MLGGRSQEESKADDAGERGGIIDEPKSPKMQEGKYMAEPIREVIVSLCLYRCCRRNKGYMGRQAGFELSLTRPTPTCLDATWAVSPFSVSVSSPEI